MVSFNCNPIQAVQKASEEAELQRMRDQARFQKELDQRTSLENQLRAEASSMKQASSPTVLSDNQLLAETEKLRKKNSKQSEELLKYVIFLHTA